MKRLLRVLAIIVTLLLIMAGWCWWNEPVPVDMAANVPADSLVYLEAESLTDIAAALTETESWKRIAPYTGIPAMKEKGWLTYLIRTTGMGPTANVIATRAQIALVLLELNSTRSGDSLEIKHLTALVVETHTSATRVKSTVEGMLGEVARRTYGQAKFERLNLSDGEFARWLAPDGQRRIVASFDGSVVVVANDERAVSACLAARRGQRPSLLHRPELEEMRLRLHAADALAFGYVGSAHVPQLTSESAPRYLIGLPPELPKLLAASAGKLIGNIGWSVRSFNGGLEDQYFLSLNSGLAERLRPTFQSIDHGLQGSWEFLPADVASVSEYNFRDPAGTWDDLNAAISSQVDVVSAVILSKGSRLLFEPYGIDDPESFLKAIKPEILTIRLDTQSERALVIAKIADGISLHQFVARRFGSKPPTERVGDHEFVLSGDKQFAASFAGDYFLLGSPEDVRRCLATQGTSNTLISAPLKLASLTHFLKQPGTSNVVTYAKDNERVRLMISTLATIRGFHSSSSPDEIDNTINELPYATTETTLGADGFERRTRSPFGQFSSLLSLLPPSPVAPR
jgi:hypothetical protein